MKRDKQQQPADTDPRAGTSEAERKEKFAQLTRRRSKLSADEAALLRKMFPAIRAAHHKHVWDRLRRAHLSRHDAEERQLNCRNRESGAVRCTWQFVDALMPR